MKDIIQPKMTLLRTQEELSSILVFKKLGHDLGISLVLKHMEVGLVPSRLEVNWLDDGF